MTSTFNMHGEHKCTSMTHVNVKGLVHKDNIRAVKGPLVYRF